MTTFTRTLLLIISVATGLMSILCFLMATEHLGYAGAFIGTAGLAFVSAQAAHYAAQ